MDVVRFLVVEYEDLIIERERLYVEVVKVLFVGWDKVV